jgi:hypothetical protein
MRRPAEKNRSVMSIPELLNRLPARLSHSQGKQKRRAVGSGNALMEYAVPAVLILLGSGLFMTLSSTTGLMATFFLSASGRSSSSLSGTTLQTQGLGQDSFGNVENGMGGISSFGSLSGGGSGGSSIYIGAVTRTGARLTATSPEYLFP